MRLWPKEGSGNLNILPHYSSLAGKCFLARPAVLALVGSRQLHSGLATSRRYGSMQGPVAQLHPHAYILHFYDSFFITSASCFFTRIVLCLSPVQSPDNQQARCRVGGKRRKKKNHKNKPSTGRGQPLRQSGSRAHVMPGHKRRLQSRNSKGDLIYVCFEPHSKDTLMANEMPGLPARSYAHR